MEHPEAGFFLIFLAIYLFPGIVAAIRRHPNQNAIAVLNILLGWALLPWIIALVWASTSTKPREVIVIHKHE
jgi:hypothetical protein